MKADRVKERRRIKTADSLRWKTALIIIRIGKVVPGISKNQNIKHYQRKLLSQRLDQLMKIKGICT
jgi:predicted membrane chloride channel (bestrophin family)